MCHHATAVLNHRHQVEKRLRIKTQQDIGLWVCVQGSLTTRVLEIDRKSLGSRPLPLPFPLPPRVGRYVPPRNSSCPPPHMSAHVWSSRTRLGLHGWQQLAAVSSFFLRCDSGLVLDATSVALDSVRACSPTSRHENAGREGGDPGHLRRKWHR